MSNLQVNGLNWKKITLKTTRIKKTDAACSLSYVDSSFESSLCLTWGICESQVIINRPLGVEIEYDTKIQRESKQSENAEGGKVQTWRGWGKT